MKKASQDTVMESHCDIDETDTSDTTPLIKLVTPTTTTRCRAISRQPTCKNHYTSVPKRSIATATATTTVKRRPVKCQPPPSTNHTLLAPPTLPDIDEEVLNISSIVKQRPIQSKDVEVPVAQIQQTKGTDKITGNTISKHATATIVPTNKVIHQRALAVKKSSQKQAGTTTNRQNVVHKRFTVVKSTLATGGTITSKRKRVDDEVLQKRATIQHCDIRPNDVGLRGARNQQETSFVQRTVLPYVEKIYFQKGYPSLKTHDDKQQVQKLIVKHVISKDGRFIKEYIPPATASKTQPRSITSSSTSSPVSSIHMSASNNKNDDHHEEVNRYYYELTEKEAMETAAGRIRDVTKKLKIAQDRAEAAVEVAAIIVKTGTTWEVIAAEIALAVAFRSINAIQSAKSVADAESAAKLAENALAAAEVISAEIAAAAANILAKVAESEVVTPEVIEAEISAVVAILSDDADGDDDEDEEKEDDESDRDGDSEGASRDDDEEVELKNVENKEVIQNQNMPPQKIDVQIVRNVNQDEDEDKDMEKWKPMNPFLFDDIVRWNELKRRW